MKWPFAATLAILAAVSFARPAAAAVDAYLKIDGIDGESQDDQHKGWIEISSYNEGAQTGGGAGLRGAGAGRSRGGPAVHQMIITRKVDRASPLFFKACASGQHYKTVMLSMRKAGSADYLQYELSDVVLSNYSTSSGGDRPTETLTLNFTKMELENRPQGSTNTLNGGTRGMIPSSARLPPPGGGN